MPWRGPEPDRGAGLLEYVLLVSLIALVAFIGVGFFGDAVNGLFGDASDAFP